jgi:hypothetical protein
MNKYKLTIGDWSGDGHEKTEIIFLETNRSSKEIDELYKKSASLTGIEFKKLFKDYEEYSLNKDVIEAFQKHGINISNCLEEYEIEEFEESPEEFGFSVDSAVKLFIEYLKLSDSELIINVVNDQTEELNIRFGYGLFE